MKIGHVIHKKYSRRSTISALMKQEMVSTHDGL